MTGRNVSSVSVLICTYNRAALLRETLDALQRMDAPDRCAVEIVVVDNNSTDDTPAVVASVADGARFQIVYLRERQQGKSFALNAGLEAAMGDVLALTDDDVLPSPHWLTRLVEDFRAFDVTFVFGKVLPRWSTAPPPELLTPRAQDIWGPLAIVDYGNEAAHYKPEHTDQRLPVGANLAFRRSLLVAIGGWRTDLGKVNNTLISGEDHEIFMRMRRLGHYAGYYDPNLTVRHFVPAGRLTRRYFRQWFYWHGKTQALMLDDIYPDLDLGSVPRFGGIPRFAYRQAFAQWARWCTTRTGDTLIALIEELRLLQYVGLFVECWRHRKKRARAALSSAGHLMGLLVLVLCMGLMGSIGRAETDTLQLTFSNGRVSLVASGVTAEQVLAEWSRLGHTQIVNADVVSSEPLQLELTDVSERDALNILLRSSGGFVATGQRETARTSRFARILIVAPASTAIADARASTRELDPINPVSPMPPGPVRVAGVVPAAPGNIAAPMTTPLPGSGPVSSIITPSGGLRLIGPDGLLVPDDQEDAPPAPHP